MKKHRRVQSANRNSVPYQTQPALRQSGWLQSRQEPKLNSLIAKAVLNADTVRSPTADQNSYRGGPLKIDMVTPELAAKIVQKFVLPMFDTDSKRLKKAKTTTLET